MTYKDALQYALDLCRRPERCRSEIAEKLEARKISPGNIGKILDALVQEKFIDEQRFSRAFSRDKLKFNKWGKMVFDRSGFLPNAPDLGWDGYTNGQPVREGTYTWAAEFVREDGLRFTCGGTVSVLR